MSAGHRTAWLAAQALALGLSTAWLVVPGNTILLVRYGSELLPITYIGAAAGGALATVALNRSLRTRPLAGVASDALIGTALFQLVAWAALWAGVDPVVFGVLVLAPLQVPIGMMFVVGQAGLLLDVRTLKALYARVVAGFALGFLLGGLTAPPILSMLGGTEHLVLCAAAAMAALVALQLTTRRRYADLLSAIEPIDGDDRQPTLMSLLRHRYVVLIIAFQVLSAIESQWLDFLVFDRAARRYDDSEQLARFIARFTAITYGVDILFLVAIAGALLRWRGLKLGLTANPIGVAVLLAAVLGASAVQPASAATVFAVVVAARAADIVLCDGMVRPSISAAYQAVPASLRTFTQTSVEGLAVPVSIGCSGVALVVMGWAGVIEGSLLPVMTAVVVACWIAVSIGLYRGYRGNLLSGLRQRTLLASDLTIEGVNDVSVVESLIESDDPRDVRLALDVLAAAGHPHLVDHLRRLATEAVPPVRIDALERLRHHAPDAAADAARVAAFDRSDDVRAAAFATLAAVGRESDLALFMGGWSDPSIEARIAAHAGSARFSGVTFHESNAARLDHLSRSASASDRVLAARIIGATGVPADDSHATIARLLADGDDEVINAALGALGAQSAERHVASVVEHLGRRHTTAAAVAALARGSDTVLDVIDAWLADTTLTIRQHVSLIRACRTHTGRRAAEVLRRHIGHPVREVGLAALHALNGMQVTTSESGEPWDEPFLVGERDHAVHVLRALVALRDDRSTSILEGALQDELSLVTRRVFACLALHHGAADFDRIALQLSQHDAQSHAIALEWLDVSLPSNARFVIALLDPALSDQERLRALGDDPQLTHSKGEVMRDLIGDPDLRWRRPWLQACAVHAAWDDPAYRPGAAAIAVARDRAFTSDIVLETVESLQRRRPDQFEDFARAR